MCVEFQKKVSRQIFGNYQFESLSNDPLSILYCRFKKSWHFYFQMMQELSDVLSAQGIGLARRWWCDLTLELTGSSRQVAKGPE